MRFALTVITALLSCMAASSVYASDIESYHYIEKTGAAKKEIQWCVDKSQPSRLVYISKGEIHTTQTNQSFATLEWKMEKSMEDTLLHARRQADTIIIDGRFKGNDLRKVLHIDEDPWYQATSWSLRPFILSPVNSVRFWTVRINTLKAYKITATKKQNEDLSLGTGNEDAIQVDLRLSGMLAPFWKSTYWFRRSDGVFLRFEGPSGPPGAPDMVVEYRGPSDPCQLAAPELLSGHMVK